MAIENLSDAELQSRADFLERRIGEERDWKSLPALNAAFQRIIEEQARRDIERSK